MQNATKLNEQNETRQKAAKAGIKLHNFSSKNN